MLIASQGRPFWLEALGHFCLHAFLRFQNTLAPPVVSHLFADMLQI